MPFAPLDIAIGDRLSCRVATAPLLDAPMRDAVACSELLHGEAVDVLAVDAGFLDVTTVIDGYRGFVEGDRLETMVDATHRVAARGTLCFAHDDIKSRITRVLPFGARLRIDGSTSPTTDGLVPTARSEWARLSHLEPLVEPLGKPDDGRLGDTPLGIAHDRFLGAPYRWGGRSPLGCDCSGLVQQAHAACGIALPRDSGPQEAALPAIRSDEAAAGDLVFWPGHVAFLCDEARVLHATAHSLSVTIEPLAAVIARAGTPSGWRRVTP